MAQHSARKHSELHKFHSWKTRQRDATWCNVATNHGECTRPPVQHGGSFPKANWHWEVNVELDPCTRWPSKWRSSHDSKHFDSVTTMHPYNSVHILTISHNIVQACSACNVPTCKQSLCIEGKNMQNQMEFRLSQLCTRPNSITCAWHDWAQTKARMHTKIMGIIQTWTKKGAKWHSVNVKCNELPCTQFCIAHGCAQRSLNSIWSLPFFKTKESNNIMTECSTNDNIQIYTVPCPHDMIPRRNRGDKAVQSNAKLQRLMLQATRKYGMLAICFWNASTQAALPTPRPSQIFYLVTLYFIAS